MERANREKALRLLARKKSDVKITYADIALETGYGRRRLMRLSKRLDRSSTRKGEDGKGAGAAIVAAPAPLPSQPHASD